MVEELIEATFGLTILGSVLRNVEAQVCALIGITMEVAGLFLRTRHMKEIMKLPQTMTSLCQE